MAAAGLEQSTAPYPGLRPFRHDEADVFFGRERQTDQLLARLGRHRFLAVVGPSGCGKSSLVAAGLLPALATGFMVEAGSAWQVAYLRPGGRPMQSLAAALLKADILDAERAARADTPVFLEAALRRGPLGLVEIARGSALEPGANLLVLVDQFEELFRFSEDEHQDEAEAFAALLVATAATPGQRIYVAITMRSDYLGECAVFHGLPEAINEGLYLTPRLTREECAACIIGPARVFEADVDPALVNRLLNDFGTDPDQLPLLQHALLRMWNRHEQERKAGVKTVLGLADYKAVGEISRSLSNHADEALAELSPHDQRVAELMFRRLSDPETAKRDRRAPAHVAEIAALAGVRASDVVRVADVFRRRGRCFLTPPEDWTLGPDDLLDVSHESLLRQWDAAKAWIADEAEAVAFYRRVKQAAREWKRGEGALWGSPNLERALAWRARSHPTPEWAARYVAKQDLAGEDPRVAGQRRLAAVIEFIDVSTADRDAAQARERQAKSDRVRLLATYVVLGGLSSAIVAAWLLLPYLYQWEHTADYASYVNVKGAPRGIGRLTKEQVRRRPLSYRIVTAGLWGSAKRMLLVNSQEEPTVAGPDHGTGQGHGSRPSVWYYDYGQDGRTLTSERQYTRSNELVLGKVYVPSLTGAVGERLAYFIGPQGTPIRVKSHPGDSSYHWAEKIRYSEKGYEERISYLGSAGEPVPGRAGAFITVNSFDDPGNLVEQTSLDARGRPMNGAAGNASLHDEHDRFGNPTESIAYDAEGNRTKVDDGWVVHRRGFDEGGNVIEDAYFDHESRRVTVKQGWHRETFKRDERGGVSEARHFDPQGNSTPDTEYWCPGSAEGHDEMNRLVRWTCVDAGGAPRKTRYGFVTRTSRYDQEGRLVELAYLDADDQPTLGEDAFAKAIFRHDDKGRLVEVSYRDTGDNPTTSKSGYARYVIEHQPEHPVERISYFGPDGEPVLVKEGYASVERTRDVHGDLVEEHYYDRHREPVNIADGYAGWRGAYDARGQRTETRYLGKGGEIVFSKRGYAGLRVTLDDRGRSRETLRLGIEGKPVVTTSLGVAGWRSSFDARDNETERTYVDAGGDPVVSAQGEAGFLAEYDAMGHQRALRYVDPKGAPALHAWRDEQRFAGSGFARKVQEFDDHGQLVEEAYFGLSGERVLRPEGWSRAVHGYDDRGRQIRSSYYGTDDRPTQMGNGYHMVVRDFDDRGNAIRIRYLGLDQKTPVVGSEGYARVDRRYDRYGNVVESSFFDDHDQKCVLRGQDVHRSVVTRDHHGRATRWEEYGREEPPNRLRTTVARYDGWGNLIEREHLDANNNLVSTSDARCAVLRWHFSERQEEDEASCLDANRSPFPHLDGGAARIQHTYGKPGEIVSMTYYDRADRPFITRKGYAGVRRKYDGLGRIVEETFVDEHGSPVSTLDFARSVLTYDERGNVIERALFRADGSPARPVAKEVVELDAWGRRVEARNLGPGDQPARLDGKAQHATRFEYDEYGNVKALRFFDKDRRPTLGYDPRFDPTRQLCGRWVARYVNGQLEGDGTCEKGIPDP